jgi:hypothetical protein
MRISNNTYDLLKWLTTIVLPAIGTLYFALSGIWGFPYGEQIVGTITALVTFFGVILGISTKQYYEDREKGIIFEDEDTEDDKE